MKHILPLILLGASLANANAQTGSDYLKAYKVADCNIPFDINAEGQPFHVKWGMDTAWDWDFNVNRGIAHFGKGNFETGRVSFQPIDLVTDNGDGTLTLSNRQLARLNTRIKMIKTTGTTAINLNCDHEVLFKKVDNRGYCQDADDATGKKNYVGKPEEWYKLIKATAQHCQAQGLTVVSVSPFNESDFVNWQQYYGKEEDGMKDFLEIAKLIKADPYFDGIRVCGGNTLNCDRALPWYNYLKEYLDEGNTHQLAGSFDTYAKFFATVKADGKVGTADELHNVGEAIVGVEYGMENGIWWGFDAKARGQFMHDSNEGVRIGYGEDRPHWVSGAVYRNEQTGEVHAFMGSSERQANPSTFEFVSTAKPVYFRGEGPAYHWQFDLPGGNGYQNGQINAELLADVTWGEDVAPAQIDGTYQIMNERSKKMITFMNGANVQTQSRKTSGKTQQWIVSPIKKDGDCSYHVIDNAGTKTAHLNLLNMNLNAGAGVITYNAGHGWEEQWYLKYAGDGYFYIIARLSNKYMYCSGTTSGVNVSMQNAPDENTSAANLKGYRWRFMPIDAKAETEAPEAPTQLWARQRTGSIELTWTASPSEDVVSYTVLRGEVTDGAEVEYNTIARGDTLTHFIDTDVTPGTQYIYKVYAVDYAGNYGAHSESITATPLQEKSLICQLQFDDDCADMTDNHLDAAAYGTYKFNNLAALIKSGNGALTLDGKSYVQLPYGLANSDEMTISAWVYMTSSGGNDQCIFSFGNSADQHISLIPNAGGKDMQFVMKSGDKATILSQGRKLAVTKWNHVAVTISADKAAMYVNGEEVASTSDLTLRPSDIATVLNYVGRGLSKTNPLYNGRIDDFRMYNYVLSADEIKAMMEDLGEVAADYVDSYEDVVPTAISAVASDRADQGASYDLSGRRVAADAKGVVISNNTKKINK